MFYNQLGQLPPIDYHVHSNWSPDVGSLVTIDKLSYLYKCNNYNVVVITDHSYSPKFLNSFSVNEYINECKKAEQKYKIKIIPGIEVDIDIEGSLTMEPNILKQFKYVVGGIHREHNINTTNRLMAAICSNRIHAIAHLTNVIYGVRDASPINTDLIFNTAAKYGVAMEINGIRKDLNYKLVKKAKKHGCKFVCGSDSHDENGSDNLFYCKQIAEEAGLTKNDFLKL